VDSKRANAQPSLSGESTFPLLQAYVALRLALEGAPNGQNDSFLAGGPRGGADQVGSLAKTETHPK
jgi:hypothetical protein